MPAGALGTQRRKLIQEKAGLPPLDSQAELSAPK